MDFHSGLSTARTLPYKKERKTISAADNHKARDFSDFPADNHSGMARPRRKKIESPFAENFKKVLDSRGISLKAASEMMGVPYATLTNLLNSQGVPNDLAAISRFCRQTSTDFEWMVCGVHSQLNLEDLPLENIFEELDAFEGLYKITAKKLVKKVSKEKKP